MTPIASRAPACGCRPCQYSTVTGTTIQAARPIVFTPRKPRAHPKINTPVNKPINGCILRRSAFFKYRYPHTWHSLGDIFNFSPHPLNGCRGAGSCWAAAAPWRTMSPFVARQPEKPSDYPPRMRHFAGKKTSHQDL